MVPGGDREPARSAFSLESPLVASLGVLLLLSAWAKLIPQPAPPLVALAAALGGDEMAEYAEADRHGGLVGGFPRYLALWGCPLGWAAGAGGAARWAAAVVEVTAAYNLAVAVTYDHRMLACGAVTILHITLLCSMALCGDLDLGTAGARPAAGSAAGALGVDGVVVTLALESMMIQMLGGALVLMGLKQSIPFEIREGSAGAPHAAAHPTLPKLPKLLGKQPAQAGPLVQPSRAKSRDLPVTELAEPPPRAPRAPHSPHTLPAQLPSASAAVAPEAPDGDAIDALAATADLRRRHRARAGAGPRGSPRAPAPPDVQQAVAEMFAGFEQQLKAQAKQTPASAGGKADDDRGAPDGTVRRRGGGGGGRRPGVALPLPSMMGLMFVATLGLVVRGFGVAAESEFPAAATAASPGRGRCDGQYCGRTVLTDGGFSSCGGCPRGYRARGVESVCEQCTDPLPRYAVMYLLTQVLLVFGLHVWGALRRSGTRRGRLLVIGSQLIETVLACLAASLLSRPFGSLVMQGCGVDGIDDWYPWLHNPATPCTAMDCANEAVYPLLTWVLTVDAVSAVLSVALRLPITRIKAVSASGVDSVFFSLYLLPVHAVLTVVLGGIGYYMYPYLLILTGTLLITVWMCSATRQTLGRMLRDPGLGPILAFGYGTAAMGIAASISYFADDDAATTTTALWTASVFGPLILVVIYLATERITCPDQIVAGLRGIGRAAR